MRFSIMTIVLFIAAAAGAQQPPSSLKLEDAYRNALKNHPSLQRTESLTGAARQRVREAQAGMMPSLNIQGTATNGPQGAPAFPLLGMAGDPLKKHYASGINLLQTVYDFGRTEHKVAAGKLLVGAAVEDEDTQKAAVLLGVQSTYLNVLRAQQLVRVNEDNVRQREETVRQAELFANAGLKADVDVQLARANLAEAKRALIAAQNAVSEGYAALNTAMGETKLTTYTLEPAAEPTSLLGMPQQAPAEELMKQADTQRPELIGADLQIRASNQTIHANRSELMPRIDGIASAGAITPSKLITNNQDYAVGVAATIPIFTGGLVEGRIDEERRKRDALIASRKELSEFVKLQVARSWLGVQTRTEQLKAAQEQVVAANASLKQATERYNLQLNNLVELLTAQAAATSAAAQLVNSTSDLTLAKAELDWATGTTYRKYTRPKRK